MTFHFPNYDTLRFALAGGAVPPDVGLAPARAGIDADGRPWVTPEATPSSDLQALLRRFGVRGEATEPAGGAAVAHWPQVFPLRHDPAAPTLTDQTPVLFELSPDQLAGLVAEMLRLGNDRQGYRWLKTVERGAWSVEREELISHSTLHAPRSTVLLRVVGPPYYSLLRALDFRGEAAGTMRTYIERAPRVWVQLGYSHPLAELLEAPEGQIVLLRAPADWAYLDEAPFTDVYEAAEFRLPDGQTDWADAPPAGKLSVPLQLAAAATTDAAELWVLHGDGLAQIDALVRDADEKLLARLAFAIGDVHGRKTAVVRARPVRAVAGQAPDALPSLALDALACRPYLRLPNLFLPVGKRLRPPLRRDAVRDHLADDPARITWLVPEQDGSFVAQSLPDEAFRPLTDWVEYVLATESDRLTAWMRAARFDFESFVSKDEMVPAKTSAPGDRRRVVSPRGERGEASASLEGEALAAPRSPRGETGTIPTAPAPEPAESRPAATPSELQVRLRQAEQRFLDADGPLDAPQRLALWPELARLNTELGQTTDAAACWLNAMWEPRDGQAISLAAWAWGWVRAEKALVHADLSTGDLDRLMANPQPTGPDMRPFAAAVIWAAAQKPTPPALRQRASAVQRYLEQHDRLLPVRAAWLAWVGLTRLAGADVLALARTRDRVLERLLSEGLSPERDLPGFLRFAGQREADRLRVVRDKAERLRQLAHDWFPMSVTGFGGFDQTPVYIDLMFAFGLARLGEVTASRALIDRASATIEAAGGETHSVLLQAFRYRIDQVLAGRPHAGALPAALIEYVDHLRVEYDQRRVSGPSGPDDHVAYVVDRLREESRILEPQERLRAYRYTDRIGGEEVSKEIAGWPDITDPRQLRGRIDRLLGPAAKPLTGELRVRVLSRAIPLAHRVGEAFCLSLVHATPAAIEAMTAHGDPDPHTIDQVSTLLERAVFFAAHYDDRTFVHAALDRLTKLMDAATGPAALRDMAAVVGQLLVSLRKFGMRDEAERLLARVEQWAFRGRPLERLKTDDARTWPQVLEMLLRLAAGWLDVDRLDLARPVLDEARAYLLRGTADADITRYVSISRAYISALGHGPVEDALSRAEELLTLGEKGKLLNTRTSSTHYSVFHLNIVEAIVLALANEEFALGPAARRWLDDDEYLVRRRIHADVRAALNQAGM